MALHRKGGNNIAEKESTSLCHEVILRYKIVQIEAGHVFGIIFTEHGFLAQISTTSNKQGQDFINHKTYSEHFSIWQLGRVNK